MQGTKRDDEMVLYDARLSFFAPWLLFPPGGWIRVSSFLPLSLLYIVLVRQATAHGRPWL